jgi:hypothetical protein
VDVYESYYPDGPHGFDQELKVGVAWDLADTARDPIRRVGQST